MLIKSLGAFVLSALLLPSTLVQAADEVGVRNLQLVKSAHNQFISATGYNKTDRTLPIVAVTFELIDKHGAPLAVQTDEFRDLGPGQAWRIWNQAVNSDGKSLRLVQVQTFETEAEWQASDIRSKNEMTAALPDSHH
jgi:hypothetical protein